MNLNKLDLDWYFWSMSRPDAEVGGFGDPPPDTDFARERSIEELSRGLPLAKKIQQIASEAYQERRKREALP